MTTEKLRYTLENPNSRAREKVSETKLNYANKVFTYPILIYQTMIFLSLRTRDSQAVIRIVLSFRKC